MRYTKITPHDIVYVQVVTPTNYKQSTGKRDREVWSKKKKQNKQTNKNETPSIWPHYGFCQLTWSFYKDCNCNFMSSVVVDQVFQKDTNHTHKRAHAHWSVNLKSPFSWPIEHEKFGDFQSLLPVSIFCAGWCAYPHPVGLVRRQFLNHVASGNRVSCTQLDLRYALGWHDHTLYNLFVPSTIGETMFEATHLSK